MFESIGWSRKMSWRVEVQGMDRGYLHVTAPGLSALTYSPANFLETSPFTPKGLKFHRTLRYANSHLPTLSHCVYSLARVCVSFIWLTYLVWRNRDLCAYSIKLRIKCFFLGDKRICIITFKWYTQFYN